MTQRAAKMGSDPLAWLDDESDPQGSAPASPDRRAPAADGGLPVALLEQSFAAIEPQAPAWIAKFYDTLFERHPEVRPLFASVSQAEQEKKLLAALRLVVNSLRRPEALQSVLAELGARHQRYGAEAAHYPVVVETLLEVMGEAAGDQWTPEVRAAWSQALAVVTQNMLQAYSKQEGQPMAASEHVVAEQLQQAGAPVPVTDDLEVLQDILEHAPMNIMIADADENVVFVNRKAREVLTELESELAKYLPDFRADRIVGGSIHRYHKDPAAIRRILHGLHPGDARRGEITPGPYIFEHETRALFNRAGERMGYVVQWQDVTEKRAKEEQAQRLQRAVDGAQTAMMTIDRDLVITYVNDETKALMQRNAEVLRDLYPGFDPEGLVGTCIDAFHRNPAHQRKLLENPANLPYETDIHVGPLVFRIRVSAIHDLKGNYVGNTLEWSDVTELRRRETEVARLTSAIEGATTSLMICDKDFVITYVNPAVVKMLGARQEQLRRIYPGFDAHNLVGKSIDMFHKNPAHQHALLRDTQRLPHHTEIQVGELVFELNATAIVDQNGDYMGNMVEWKDITEQKDAERQIESLIQVAAGGDLSQRLDTDRYQGFMKQLGDAINQLMDTVVSPLRETARIMETLAGGDLTERMEGEYHGEFATLRESVNATVDKLREIVGSIRASTNNISAAAGEIAQGNQDLSQRTEEQASSLEETASSMEELTSTVKQNADNARQANQLASSAREQAEKGGEVVRSAITAMSEINDASKKIADIISVIDEIAFQTNLLALNAAVEAARAGEQGRGFAVVASEVRNLAQRSAAAAKEIKALINDSVAKVDGGSELVNQSGEMLEEIVNAVKRVSDIIAEIAAASQEQSAGIEQVNKAVMQLDDVTQQNAALVEQAAAASESLDDQARGLAEMVGFFRIGEAAAAQARPPRVAAGAAPRAARKPAARPAPRRSRQRPEDGEWEEF